VAKLASNIGGHVLTPSLRHVEADDPNRALVLSGEQIGDDGFEVSRLDVGFPTSATIAAKVVGRRSDRRLSVR
jgi:hypothetical protein